MKHLLLTIVCLIAWTTLSAQDMRQDTYCNPLNIDYTYMIYNSDRDISYRSGADPAVVEFRGEYYMFVTRSHGYWRSRDLLNWEFVRPGKNWYPQGCNAPAAHNYKDSVLYVAGDPSGSMSILIPMILLPVIGKLRLPFCIICKILICLLMTMGKLICSGDLPMFTLSGVWN